jgi:hypothetical protein
MGVIVMWRSGARRCHLVVSGDACAEYTLQVLEGACILRSELMASADCAAAMSRLWEADDSKGTGRI